MIQDNAAPAPDKGKMRKLIRKKVVEILKGNTDVGDAIFPNASVPPWHTELPVILVYPRSEGAAEYGVAPRELERDLDLALEIIASGPEENSELETPGTDKSLEDTLDDIAEQIEAIISADDSLQGTADNTILTNTEFEFDAAGGSPIGSCRLTFAVTYYTMSPRDITQQSINDSQGIEDYETNEVEWNIGDDEDTREATDTVDVPTT